MDLSYYYKPSNGPSLEVHTHDPALLPPTPMLLLPSRWAGNGAGRWDWEERKGLKSRCNE